LDNAGEQRCRGAGEGEKIKNEKSKIKNELIFDFLSLIFDLE
jgi:hypothetical protein